ncbi:hypothetical protein D3C81_1954590 [compost metagenome]
MGLRSRGSTRDGAVGGRISEAGAAGNRDRLGRGSRRGQNGVLSAVCEAPRREGHGEQSDVYFDQGV